MYGKNYQHMNRPTSLDRSNGSTGSDNPKNSGPLGCPPQLKGKEIGLYYRNLARMRSKNAAAKNHEKASRLILYQDVKKKINSALNMISSNANDDDFWFNRMSIKSASNDIEKKYVHIKMSPFKMNFLEIITGSIEEKIAGPVSVVESLRNSKLDTFFLEMYRAKQNCPMYKKAMETRQKLPSYKMRNEILQMINENQVVVISGETGCGKTTQVAQFILDDQIEKGNGSITKIICTQPRRISAISIANRVAVERAEPLGESVGFQIRLEKVQARERASILFCTTGVLLQFMQNNIMLKGYSHIIIDEIHERSTESDFILTLLKQIIPKRPDLKVILMSATLNSDSFSKYYDDCPILHIPGYAYFVKEFYLEDVLQITEFKFPATPWLHNSKHRFESHLDIQSEKTRWCKFIHAYVDKLIATNEYPRFVINQLSYPDSEMISYPLIETLIWHICSTERPGAILVFLPGIWDITTLNKIMLKRGRYPRNKFIIYSLHSHLPSIDQKLIFDKPPDDVRKIILATSIAETSITIEDVVYVIDSGKIKVSKFDVEKDIQTLMPEWVTLANAKQRQGRAGRVQPGNCYHLYTKARRETLDDYPIPEMLRTRLEQLILRIKILQLGKAEKFFSCVMDPPDPRAVSISLDLLKSLKALDNDENLTPLGYHLSKLSLDPRTGKMIIWAAMFSCVEPVFAIAASLSFKTAFYIPLDQEKEALQCKKDLSCYEYSDHIALAEALRKFEMARKNGDAAKFCHEYFLSFNTLKLLSEMKHQFAQQLYEMKFLSSNNPSDPKANMNSNNRKLIKAIVCMGLFPNVAIVLGKFRKGLQCEIPAKEIVFVHPSSVNDTADNLPSPYLVYFMKQRSTSIFLHDTSCITPAMLMLADENSYIRESENGCKIVSRLTYAFDCNRETAVIIKKLQRELSQLLEYKAAHPGTVSWESREGYVLDAIIEFISQETRP